MDALGPLLTLPMVLQPDCPGCWQILDAAGMHGAGGKVGSGVAAQEIGVASAEGCDAKCCAFKWAGRETASGLVTEERCNEYSLDGGGTNGDCADGLRSW